MLCVKYMLDCLCTQNLVLPLLALSSLSFKSTERHFTFTDSLTALTSYLLHSQISYAALH